MKILITGGGGYIGSYIINNLPKKYDIICLDHGKKYSQFNKSVKRYQCSYHRALKKEQNSFVNKTPVFLPTDFMEKNRDQEDKMISDFPGGLEMFSSFSGKQISNVMVFYLNIY